MRNLAKDPAMAGKLKSLRRRLDRWRREQGDPEPVETGATRPQ
jgi:hypothetical protein